MIVFLGIGFGWRAWLQKKRFGRSGVILFRSTRLGQMVRDLSFLLALTVTVGQAIFAALAPERMMTSVIDGRMMLMSWTFAGMGLMIAGTTGMVIAQLHLGVSWRIGIEEGARPGLIRTGLYRFSRNPIFVGMLIALSGMAVMIPTWLSMALLVFAVACVRSQVLEEEEYLQSSYGTDFADYARHVGRFVPMVGRIS